MQPSVSKSEQEDSGEELSLGIAGKRFSSLLLLLLRIMGVISYATFFFC